MMPSHAGRRHLDQAELGIIGLVAQEFGVQRQIGRLAQLRHKGAQGLVGLDNPHCGVLADSGGKRGFFIDCGLVARLVAHRS